MRTQTPQKRELFACALRTIVLGVFAVFVFAVVIVLRTPGVADAATSSTINFQARLQTAAGAVVPDGNYNVEFKLYDASTAGTNLWTETRENNAGNGVTVRNGYLSVSLGSVTAFPGTINWDQDLWLTMNIGGTTTGVPGYDGEMNPRLKLTSTPYAFQAKSASQLQQLQSGHTGTLLFGSLTSDRSVSLPDEDGTVCLQGKSSCGFLDTTTADSSYIKLQGSTPGSAQTGNFNISGTGIADILQANTFDRSSSGALNIGTTNATSINLNQNTTIASGKTLTVNGSGFDGSGNLGIGTTSPSANLEVQSASASGEAVNISVDNLTAGNGLKITQTMNLASAINSSGLINIDRNITSVTSSSSVGVGTHSVIGTGVVSSNISGSHTVDANTNRYLLVGVVTATGIPTSVTYGGISLTYLGSQTTNARLLSYYGLVAPTVGTATLSIDAPVVYFALSTNLYNVDQTTPAGSTVGTGGTGTSSTVNVSTLNGSIVVGIYNEFSTTNTITSGSGETLIDPYSSGSAGAGRSVYKNGSAGTTTITETISTSSNQTLLAIPIYPVAGSTSTIQGDLANLSSNCTVSSAACSDTSSILNLNQQYASATGSVLKVQNAGTGKSIDILNGSGTSVASFDNAGNFTASGTGTAATLQAATFDTATGVALNIGTTNATLINLNQNTVIASGKTLTANGDVTIKSTSATAFDVQNATGTSTFTVDASGRRVGINTSPTTYGLDVNGTSRFGGSSATGLFSIIGASSRTLLVVDSTNDKLNLQSLGNATSGNQTRNSMSVNLTGNYWNGSASVAQTFTLQNIVATSGINSRLAFLNDSGTEVVTFNSDGTTNFTGQINAVAGYKYNGTAGATTTCSGGQFLQNQVVQGGIVTGGTCAAAGGTGINAIGALDGGTANANGATISGTTFYLQSASASYAGLVNTTAQTFAGAKTFNGNLTVDDASKIVAKRIEHTGAGGTSYINFGNTNGTDIYDVNQITLYGTNTYIGVTSGLATYTLTVGGDINTSTQYRIGGTAGATTTCTGGNVLQDAVIQGGIITGGTCVANGGGTTGVTLQATTPGTADTGNFNITGTGIAATFKATGFDTAGAGTSLYLGQTNATTINIGRTSNSTTINIGASTSPNVINIGNTQLAGSINIGSAMTTGTITLGGTGNQTGTINLGVGTGAQTINLGTGGTNAKQIYIGGTAANNIYLGDQQYAGLISIGSSLTVGTVSIGGYSTTGTITIGEGGANQTIKIGTTTGTSTKTVLIGGTLGASATTIQSGSGGISLSGNTTLASGKTLSVSGTTTLSYTGGNSLAVTGAPTNSATSSLIQVGNAIASGNTSASGGTYIGLNAPSTGAGSAADFFNFQKNGVSKALLGNDGTLVLGGDIYAGNLTANFTVNSINGYAFNGTSGATTTCTAGNVLQNAVIQGGIVTGGTCVANGGGTAPTLQDTYDNSTSPATILLADAKNFVINAADTTTDPSILFNLQCVTSCGSNGRFAVQNAGTDVFTVNPNGNVVVGNSTNGVNISVNGIVLTGTARNAKTIRLSAEYAGAVLDAGTGSSNSGTMTSGLDLTNRMNYYKWTTTQATNQSYDVVVQVPVPSDFDSWASNPLSITTYTSDTTNGTITLEARDTGGTVQCSFVAVTPGSTTTWATNNTACTLSSGTYTAGGYMTLRIRMQSPTSGDVRIGNITLNYLSKF